MNLITKDTVTEDFHFFLNTYSIQIDDKEFIPYLQEIELLSNSKEDRETFENQYQYTFHRLMKKVYNEILKNESTIKLKDENNELRIPDEIPSKEDIQDKIGRAFRDLDGLFSTTTDYVIKQSERKDKYVFTPSEFVFAGATAKDLEESVNDFTMRKSVYTEYLENRDKSIPMLDEANQIFSAAAKLEQSYSAHEDDFEAGNEKNVRGQMAIGTLEQKAAAIYKQMYDDYKEHNFLWRFFLGHSSRVQLENYRDSYRQAFHISKGNAEQRLLRLADGPNNVTINHMAITKGLAKEKFYEEAISLRRDNLVEDELASAVAENEILSPSNDFVSDLSENPFISDDEVNINNHSDIEKFDKIGINEDEIKTNVLE